MYSVLHMSLRVQQVEINAIYPSIAAPFLTRPVVFLFRIPALTQFNGESRDGGKEDMEAAEQDYGARDRHHHSSQDWFHSDLDRRRFLYASLWKVQRDCPSERSSEEAFIGFWKALLRRFLSQLISLTSREKRSTLLTCYKSCE